MVHEGEAEVRFFGGEVDLEKNASVMAGGFPTDLFAQAGLVAPAALRDRSLRRKQKRTVLRKYQALQLR